MKMLPTRQRSNPHLTEPQRPAGVLFLDKQCVCYMYLDVKFVCVEVLRPSQPNRVMSSAVSLPNHTFTGQTQSSKLLTSIVHILSPETDNCPS